MTLPPKPLYDWPPLDAGDVGCLLLDTGCIAHHCPEIRHIAFLASYIDSLLASEYDASFCQGSISHMHWACMRCGFKWIVKVGLTGCAH
jgi:hypothetical protein